MSKETKEGRAGEELPRLEARATSFEKERSSN